MAWVFHGYNRYYYRSERSGPERRTVYVGAETAASWDAHVDTLRRKRRRRAAEKWQADADRRAKIESDVDRVHHIAMSYAELLMNLAGYYRHKRGEWRKRRPLPA